MRNFVSLDLETSGLDPHYHEIIEVGLIVEKRNVVYDGDDMTPYSVSISPIALEPITFSLPFNETKADPKALEVNGWGQRVFPQLWDPARAAGFLFEMLNDCHIIGKNPKFDTDFLAVLFEKYGLSPNWHHRLVDIGPLAWGWYNAHVARTPPHTQPPNSEQVAKLTGVEWSDRHTALADATFAYEVFRKVVPAG